MFYLFKFRFKMMQSTFAKLDFFAYKRILNKNLSKQGLQLDLLYKQV